MEVKCEVAKGGEEVASNEVGFLWERERVEVVESEGEEGGRGEES